MYFSAFFMLVGALGFLMKSLLPGLDSHIDGWAWLALALVVWLWTPAFFKSPALLTVIVLALDVAVPCIAIRDLGLISGDSANKVLGAVAGWALLAAGCSAIYLSAAMIVNGTYGRKILPNPVPIAREREAKQGAGPSAQA